jgi:uncharacterized protein DUF3800
MMRTNSLRHVSIGDIAKAICPSSDRRHLVASFTAYFDESGTHASAAVVAVAGFISTVERWRNLEREWSTVLRMYKLEYFHMTDFENRQGPYRDWDNAQRETVIKRLLGIIKRYALSGFSAAVVRGDYERLRDEYPGRLVTPYGVCAAWCLRDVADWLDSSNRDEYASYVFERGFRGAGHMVEAFGRASDEVRRAYRFGALSFADKRAVIPLQAADILAYEACKQVPRRMGADGRPTRKSAVSLGSRVPLRGKYFTYETLCSYVPDGFQG